MLYGDHPQLSDIPSTDYHDCIIIFVNILRPLYAAAAWYFGAPKYPKRFVNPAMGLLHHLTHIKKTAALSFVFKFFFKIQSAFMNTKPLRFRFGSAMLDYCATVFLISPALGIDGVLRYSLFFIKVG